MIVFLLIRADNEVLTLNFKDHFIHITNLPEPVGRERDRPAPPYSDNRFKVNRLILNKYHPRESHFSTPSFGGARNCLIS